MGLQEAWRREFRIRLETPRLALRPLVAEDVEWLTRLYCDPEVNRFLWAEAAGSPERMRREAEAVVELDGMMCRFGHWAIEDRATGVVCGWTELGKLRLWSGPSDEIGLSYVVAPEFWGRGIATEAAGRLLRHALEVLGLECVMAVIMVGNKASRRVLKKLGMRPVGRRAVSGKRLEFFRIEK